ncbi:MAG: hypothetical protein MUF42_04795 [Cytophagaceae bacterium]|jgi:hypothetical protein|nr:hypothetical protein [Cytophagaceae bacterium]
MKLCTQSELVKEIHKSNWKNLPLEKLRKMSRDYSLLREARLALLELITEKELVLMQDFDCGGFNVA